MYLLLEAQRFTFLLILSVFVVSDVLSKAVAFSATLRDTVTLKLDGETLMPWDVKSGVGGGFNPETGCFKVPVSGVYCFLLTTRPRSEDIDQHTALYIRLDGANIITFCAASGQARGMAHGTVHAKAGQSVRVVSWGCRNNCLGDWSTTFTGFLVHPDV
jgi:hypothetical protein